MSQKVYQNNKKGSITVYLTIILFLIFTLILTTIEGARVSVSKTFAERALFSAMDFVLAEYYGPLLEDYHLFGLNIEKDIIEDRLKDYMSYTFEPNQGILNPFIKKGSELYQIEVENLSITGRTSLYDYQGGVINYQAVEYMKYEKVADVIEALLEKVSMLDAPNKISRIYKEKQKVENELVEIDTGVLKLMMLLDGIKTSNKGIAVTKKGYIQTVEYYVKKICPEPVTMERVGINHITIYQVLQDKYYNPTTPFTKIETELAQIDTYNRRKEYLQDLCNELSIRIVHFDEAIVEREQVSKKTKEIISQINELKKQKQELEKQISLNQTEIREYEQYIQQGQYVIRSQIDDILKLVSNIVTVIDDTLPVLHELSIKVSEAEGKIKNYEEYLYGERDAVGEDIFHSLYEDLSELKRYEKESGGYDFENMAKLIQRNKAILRNYTELLELSKEGLAKGRLTEVRSTLRKAEHTICNYSNDGLSIDYSTLVLDKDKKGSPFDHIQSILKEGAMGLILDKEEIPKQELTQEDLPSNDLILLKIGIFEFNLLSILDKAISNVSGDAIGNVMGGFSEESSVGIDIGMGINMLARHLLFQEYVIKHFKHYEGQPEAETSVLTCEQEYILMGKLADKDNLSSVIARILSIRTLMNFVSILGDREKCNEASIAAAGIVGFTGLPILVTITKTLILLIWAFAEALVDTCALLKGKGVSFFKRGSDFMITFKDLFIIKQPLISEKAEGMDSKGFLDIYYKDYLRLFYFMKGNQVLVYRSMDLIQENIRLRYDNSFSIRQCLFAFQVNSTFLIKSKFIRIPYIKRYSNNTGLLDGYRYNITREYSY